MSTRNTILETLKTELKTIKSTNDPYQSDVAEVRRGEHHWKKIVNKPFVGVAMGDEDVDEEYYADIGSDQLRNMNIHIYIYMDTDGYGNYDDAHQLLHDIEYFLKYDFTYKDSTYVNRIVPFEGGVGAPQAYFGIDIITKYIQEIQEI